MGCSSGSCGTGAGEGQEQVQGFVPLGNLSKPLIAPPPPVTKPVVVRPAEGTQLMVGLDVGSTTVKAVVVDPATDKILWRDYQRHDTKQPEKVLEFLGRMQQEVDGFQADRSRMFITGSGGNGMARYMGAKFVQEVNAVSLAVER